MFNRFLTVSTRMEQLADRVQRMAALLKSDHLAKLLQVPPVVMPAASPPEPFPLLLLPRAMHKPARRMPSPRF